jgi:hypothetical protein
MKRVATKEAAKTFGGPLNDAVFNDRGLTIHTAGWSEATVLSGNDHSQKDTKILSEVAVDFK